jgi:NADP-dependent 3-hydroxy acid dehydrogenase YdfG
VTRVGLVTGLLTLPLAPVRGVGWVARRIADAGEEELYDPARLRQELQELARALEDGTLTPEEFDVREDELLDLLDEAERRATAGWSDEDF